MLGLSMMMGGRDVYDITLGSNRAQWQRTVDAPQIPSTSQVLLILRVSAEIQSNSTSIGALHLDGLADGSEVQILNTGYVIGDGGNGGDGGEPGVAGTAGTAGGPAIRADFTGSLILTNNLGRIWGGGGGGGGGGASSLPTGLSGGGGGGGAGGGSLGFKGDAGSADGTSGTTGSSGTNGTGGAGAAGNGGNGGAYAVAGSSGQSSVNAGGSGGAAGYAIKHNAGTVVSFISGETSPSVKGTVGT